MKKNKLKIGDVARELGIKKSIIRQWEHEFNLKTSENDKQHYSNEDMIVLRTIKDLIRTQGLSLDDAKKQLQQMNPATKYVEQHMGNPVEPSQAAPQKLPIVIPKKKKESMTTITIKAKPVEKIEEKQEATPPIEADTAEIPVEAKPIETVEIKAVEVKQEVQPEPVSDSKNVHHQLSSLKEKLLKFKKLLN